MGTGEEPPARRENGGRRRRWMGDEDDDDEEYVADEEEEEEDFAEELPASSAGEEGEDSDAEYQEDEDEEEEETPRPVKAAARSRKRKMDPATARARKRRYEEDDDYEEEPDDDDEYHEEIEEEDEEGEEATPRPKSAAKCARLGHKAEVARSNRKSSEDDMDFEPELDDDEEEVDEDIDFDPVVARSNWQKIEEIEEEEEGSPRPKSVAKSARRGHNAELARSNRRKIDEDMDFEPELDDEEDEVDEDIDFDPVVARSNRQKFEEIEEEEEEETPRPKSVAKTARRGHNAELARSNRRKIDEDMDFEPELDDEEEEVDEDIDFDPDVDDDEEDEFEDEDEDEEEFAARSRKVTNPVKRKSVSKRRSLKKKKANKGSKDSKRKRKTGSGKSKKSVPIRRKRFVVGDSEEDSEDDDDFIVEDEVEVIRPPRKKARTGTSKRTDLDLPSVEGETWPNLDSDTSEFEFVTSDEDRDDGVTTVVEAGTVRKGRKRRKFGSESSSDSEFIVSDKELDDLKETEPPKVLPVLSTPIRKISISTRHGEDKGKEKSEPEEAGIPICGICLSEEQRATVQGVLNCCSHYFCFACIMEWSRVESRCPLCKQRFTTITKSSKADLGLGLRKAIIKVEERDQVYQPTEEEIRRWLDPYENVVCIECNQGGDDSLMLLCDICDSSAHTYCVGLGREVPEGNWYCGGCRLSDEGPSHARVAHTVGYERQSHRNVDFSSVGFGVAAQNGTYERSLSINRRRSIQGIDLNLSPREVPGETHPAESQVSTDSVSTPSGTRATVSGRRQIHRMIRILLSGHRNGAVPRTDLNHRSFRSSSEANTSQILPDGFQNQYNGLPFAPSPVDGDDFQHIEGVKSNLRNAQ